MEGPGDVRLGLEGQSSVVRGVKEGRGARSGGSSAS